MDETSQQEYEEKSGIESTLMDETNQQDNNTKDVSGNEGNSEIRYQGLYYVDFKPKLITPGRKTGGAEVGPVFEGFRSVVDAANKWLKDNPGFQLICAESVVCHVDKNGAGDFSALIFRHVTRGTKIFMRGLRLWMQQVGFNSTLDTQQLDYVDVTPHSWGDKFLVFIFNR